MPGAGLFLGYTKTERTNAWKHMHERQRLREPAQKKSYDCNKVWPCLDFHSYKTHTITKINAATEIFELFQPLNTF